MFTFNKDYDDREQVRPYMAAFLAVKAEIESAGRYPYNESFKGRIPGIEGPSEDTAIYLLQRLAQLDEERERKARFLAEGGEEVLEVPAGTLRRGTVVHYGFYMGGTGWTEWHDACLIRGTYGPAVLPKGKRTRGHMLTHGILFKAGE